MYVGSHLKDGAITVQIPHHCKPSSNNNFFVESNVRSSQNSKATSDSAPYTNPTMAGTEHSGSVKDPGKASHCTFGEHLSCHYLDKLECLCVCVHVSVPVYVYVCMCVCVHCKI